MWYFLFFCWIMELFLQCGIFCFSVRLWNCSYSVVSLVFQLDYGTVPAVWYLLFFCWIMELFLQCGIFYFSVGLWNCSYRVVFFVFLLDYGTVPTVWYLLFFILFMNKNCKLDIEALRAGCIGMRVVLDIWISLCCHIISLVKLIFFRINKCNDRYSILL